MSTPIPVHLADDKTPEVLNALPKHMLQARRMIYYLANNPRSASGFVSHDCSIGNLSDVARSANPYIFKHGLIIACERPIMPIMNKFDEQSNQFLWSLYKMPEAATAPPQDMPEAANDATF